MREKLNIIWGIKGICDAIGVDKSCFYKLLKEGLPATKMAGRWVAHRDRLDRFFFKRTKEQESS